MNCKQGDLAVIVGSWNPKNLGAIVRVIGPFVWSEWPEWTNDAFQCWVIESEGRLLIASDGSQHRRRPYGDENLRPIRDPGDDATDEMIELLGRPVREGETV